MVDYNYPGSVDSVYVQNGIIVIMGDSGQITVSQYTPPLHNSGFRMEQRTIMPDGSIVVTNLFRILSWIQRRSTSTLLP